MRIFYMRPEDLGVCGSLLLPDVAGAMARGEPVSVIGLEDGDVVCGACGGYWSDGVFQIASLFVAPDYRRKGGGRMLIEGVARVLATLPDPPDMCVAFVVTKPEHETLAPFLAKMDFVPEQGVRADIVAFSLEDAANADFFKRTDASASKGDFLPFSEAPAAYLRAADQKARMRDVHMPAYLLTDARFDRDVSVAHMRGSEADAFLAFDRSCAGALTLACVSPGDNPSTILSLLREAFRRAALKYPPETRVALQPVNENSAKILQNILPDATSISFHFRRSVHEIAPAATLSDALFDDELSDSE